MMAQGRHDSKLAGRLDALIAAFAPSWALRRAQARLRLRAFTSYEALIGGRLNKVRLSVGGKADRHADATTLWQLREICRDLDRQNSLAQGILNTMVDNVIGSGCRPQARTNDPDWNQLAEDYFLDWSRTRADIRRIQTFGEIQRTAFRSVLRDGDVGFILRSGQLQAIEADRIGTPTKQMKNQNLVNGVEMDADGRPQAYWIADKHPTSAFISGGATRVPAEDFIHLYRPTRFSLTRGVPVLAPVIGELDRLDDYVEAVIVASQIGACFALVVKQEAGWETARGTAETNPRTSKSEQVEEIEPGMIQYLAPGEDIEQISPQQPQQNMAELVDTLVRFCVRNLGLPLELGLLNFSHSNFSNTRAALLQAYRTFECWQTWFKDHFLRRVWRYVISHAIKAGDLPQPKDGLPWAHEWIAPGWVWVDPTRETQADVLALVNNLTTQAEICSKRGRDWQEVLKQRSREIEEAEKLNLPTAPGIGKGGT